MHLLAGPLLLLNTEISLSSCLSPCLSPCHCHRPSLLPLLVGPPAAAYPAAYGQISQAFPQPPPMIPQQQREGESASRAPRPLPAPFSPQRGCSPGPLAGCFVGKMTIFVCCVEGEGRWQDCELWRSPSQAWRCLVGSSANSSGGRVGRWGPG